MSPYCTIEKERRGQREFRRRERKRRAKANLGANSRHVVGRSKIVEEVNELKRWREGIRFGRS